MNDRDDFAELVGSARSAIKCSSLYFNGRIRCGTKGEKVEERLLCMDAIRVYICSVKIPVKIESEFNILSIKLIERISDSHITIETDEKQIHALYGLHDKSSLEPFLVVLIRCLHAVFPHRLQAIVDIRPENEYDRLLSLSSEYYQDIAECRPCGGYSLHYECACDFHNIPVHKVVQILVDTVFVHRISREFTFREFESIVQKEWLPIISALRYNDWFRKITIENIKLSTENIDELRTVIRLCSSIRDLRLINCGLKHDFGTRLSHSLSLSHVENLDLSNNALEDKGLIALCSSFHQRKLPLVSINLQSCSLTHKSLYSLHTALITNNYLLKSLQILNLSGNRIKEENCITILFQNTENVLEELHLSDIEFSLESFFHSLTTVSCKLRRLFITSVAKASVQASNSGGVKLFMMKNETLEILQLSNTNLSFEFLKELCDGLHANVHLNALDLRLSGNQLEGFIHEYAARFASIPCLTALDIAGCDIDNEIPNFLGELKKNRKLKTFYLGRNFNNIKQKTIQKTISAMKDLVLDSNLEYFSIADSKLKEYIVDFLLALTNNCPLKVLDIRGNLMGETGARAISHILQMNRNLHTIYLDRNLLCLSSFEEIVNSMDENYAIQYLPVPIADIIQMKITEKDRMEKVQILITKLDTICAKNQKQKDSVTSNDPLIVSTTANLTRERNLSWEYQQQLIGDQTSLNYILSCSNRTNQNNPHTDVNSILTRTANITKISNELYENYIEEEEYLKNEWNEMCRVFQQKYIEKNERLAKKCYQLYKEQGMINYDDKFQEQIRTYFANSNENVNQLLHEEIPNRLVANSRQCYLNVNTCLRKRAYDTTNEMATDMHKQLETAMFATRNPALGSIVADTSRSTPPSTLERTTRANSVTYRSTQKHIDNNEEVSANRQGKIDAHDLVSEQSPKRGRTAAEKSQRLTPTPQLKSTIPASSKPIHSGANDGDSSSNSSDPIYGNVQLGHRMKKREIPIDDEGDLIEHDLLSLVQEEQERDLPPELPIKKRSATTTAITTTHENNNNQNLGVNVEPTTKLVHLGKDRPRRANVRRPAKRSTDGTLNDSSSDNGLLTDENDDTSQRDIRPKTPIDIPSSVEPQPHESPASAVAKLIKSTVKPLKTTPDEALPTQPKTPVQPPVVQRRPSSNYTMTRSMTISNTESPSPQTNRLDATNESSHTKPSMSASLYSTLVLPNNNNNEQKDSNKSPEPISPQVPPVTARVGKAAVGTRVLPVLDPNRETPQVILRQVPADRKAFIGVRSPSTEQAPALDVASTGNPPASPLSPSNTVGTNEQYKPISVKQRVQMLGTTVPTGTPNDKKPTTTLTSPTPPYTPRTYRRIIEQVNLFC